MIKDLLSKVSINKNIGKMIISKTDDVVRCNFSTPDNLLSGTVDSDLINPKLESILKENVNINDPSNLYKMIQIFDSDKDIDINYKTRTSPTYGDVNIGLEFKQGRRKVNYPLMNNKLVDKIKTLSSSVVFILDSIITEEHTNNLLKYSSLVETDFIIVEIIKEGVKFYWSNTDRDDDDCQKIEYIIELDDVFEESIDGKSYKYSLEYFKSILQSNKNFKECRLRFLPGVMNLKFTYDQTDTNTLNCNYSLISRR